MSDQPGVVAPPDIFLPEGRTDTANARRYSLRYGGRVRWCETWNGWLVWDGQRWAPDVTLRANELGKVVWQEILSDSGVTKNE